MGTPPDLPGVITNPAEMSYIDSLFSQSQVSDLRLSMDQPILTPNSWTHQMHRLVNISLVTPPHGHLTIYGELSDPRK